MRPPVSLIGIRALVLATGLATAPVSADQPTAHFADPACPSSFHDVAAGRFYTTAVAWMVNADITTGTTPHHLLPRRIRHPRPTRHLPVALRPPTVVVQHTGSRQHRDPRDRPAGPR